ncbi:MAG TPA: hypothetical protein VGT61_07620 [Thermomicrobiales bacterium]|jgi:hypothetical protein|nr:hypothetical protein [Thermomicrobiales bacterium]
MSTSVPPAGTGAGTGTPSTADAQVDTPADHLRVAAEALTNQIGVPTTLTTSHDKDARIVPAIGSAESGPGTGESTGDGSATTSAGTVFGALIDAAADIRNKVDSTNTSSAEAGSEASPSGETTGSVKDSAQKVASTVTDTARNVLPGDAGDRAKTILSAGGTPRLQRLVAWIILVVTISGFARWAVRRLGGPDLSWLGPSRIRPAVLGVGFASLAASLYVDDETD